MRPENLINITGYISPSQAAGVKSSCMPDPPLTCIHLGRLLPWPGGGEHAYKDLDHTLSTAMPKKNPLLGLERESMQAERCLKISS